MIGLSPHLQPENLNAFKNTTGTFLRAATALALTQSGQIRGDEGLV